MNGIVRVTKKPVNLIDAYRSELSKDARRVSDALDPRSVASLNTLAENVAAAELMVAAPDYQALVGTLEAALAPASVADISRELGLLFACYPAKDVDISVLVACAVDEVIREQPSLLRLLVSVRRIRRKCKFRPSIAEIIEALEHAGTQISKARQVIDLPKRLDEAASRLQRLVNVELSRIRGLLSDRDRRVDGGKTVRPIDAELKDIRENLGGVLAHRAKALEAQRLLITQSISITESEKVTMPW